MPSREDLPVSGELPQYIEISLTVDVSKGRALGFRTAIDRESSLAWMNTLLDKINAAADRQMAVYELDALEFQLRHDKRVFEQCTTDYFAIEQRIAREWATDTRRKGDPKLTAKEEQEKTNAKSMMERMQAQIGAVQDKITEIKAKVGTKHVA
jgi:hypothetical protein